MRLHKSIRYLDNGQYDDHTHTSEFRLRKASRCSA